MTKNLYALLVGIDRYPYPVNPLRGCVNDITGIEAYLRERTAGGDLSLQLRVLKDDEATRQVVIDGFREHLCQAGPDDVAFFYYAGHGSQEPAPPEFWPWEPDHLNETLVCCDSRTPGGWDLADKELARLIAEVAEPGPHVVVVLDCCHSGSGTREVNLHTSVRRIPTDSRRRPLDSYLFSLDELPDDTRAAPAPGENPSGWLSLPEGRHVLLAACRDRETAKEYFADGETHGAFSYFLRTTLENASGPLTYRDVFRRARARVLAHVAAQTPQLEVSQITDLDQPFLGGAVVARPGYFSVSHSPDGWILEAGAVHGIPMPVGDETTVLALFPLDTPAQDLRDLSQSCGQATVTGVLPHISRVALANVSSPDPSATYKAVIVSLPLPPVEVSLAGDGEALALIRGALAHSGPDSGPSLYVREATSAPQLCLQAQAGAYVITRPADGRPLVAEVQGYSDGSAALIVRRLEHIARWIKTAELDHPGGRIPPGAVEMSIICGGAETAPDDLLLEYRYENGKWRQPTYTVRLKNNFDESLYCAVLGLWESFAIDAPYFPAGGVWLEPGQEVHSKLMYASVPKSLWEAGVTERRDLLKLIACSAEFDAVLLKQSALDAPSTRSARAIERKSALNRLLDRVQTRDAGAVPEDEVYDDWVTDQVVMTVRRPRHTAPVPRSGEPLSLGAGVTLAPHPDLVANARLGTVPQAGRDLGNLVRPPFLREETAFSQPFQFTASRSSDPGLDVLELGDVVDHTVVTPENPLRLTIAAPLDDGERVLAYGFDGEFFLPLGYAQATDGQTRIDLTHLPAPVAEGQRDLKGAIYILFQKFASKPLGLPYEYPILAVAQVDKDGQTVYEKDPDQVREQVRQAKQITLCVHGWTGDTRTIAAGVAACAPDDLILAFDYESIHTPIEELARGLKKRLESVGLGPKHEKTLRIVGHSLGGLVTRWFVEREGGDEIAQHVVILGTPSAGTPWATIQQWASIGIGIALNSISTVTWPVKVLGSLLAAFEKVDVTLDQIQPGSEFLESLAASPDPHVPYTLIAGNTSIIPAALEPEPGQETSRLERLFTRMGHDLASLAFFKRPNDVAVSVKSVGAVEENRLPHPQVVEVACDHMTFFVPGVGVDALTEALKSKS